MLHLIRSNRVEALVAGLARCLSEEPLASPFVPERVVVPSPAMARWVNLQLARRLGVAANIAYPLPASFLWQLASGLLHDLPEQDPLDRERMAWRLFALLPQLIGEPGCGTLRRYLADDGLGLKRWELASRIADVFDRYQLYRPALIRGWEAGGADDWQGLLWRRLTAEIAAHHRVAVIDRLLEVLAGQASLDPLPERVSLFAISSLPPLLVEVLHALAAHCHVHLYLHTPTGQFWADLDSQREQARRRLDSPEEADLWEVGNSLLASWGRQGQALRDLLLGEELPMEERDAFAEPAADSLLHRLQGDIFALRPTGRPEERITVAVDDTIEVHICHSPLRECQVLHDRLLAMLNAEPDLRPEDILVMIPEIGVYAPYVEAVFDQDASRSRPFIPWNLSDIAAKEEHPLAQVFLGLLQLPESRFSQSEVLSYLDVPELATRFGLDGDAVTQIKAWLAQARLRWGLNGAHKDRLGLPATEENTWAQAEQRLFAGYALGDAELFAGIAPIGRVEGSKAAALGGFWRLLDRLSEAAERLAVPRRGVEWQSCLGELLDGFLGERDDAGVHLQRIRDAVADLAEQTGVLDEPIALPLVRRWLEQRLGAEPRHGRYFSGGVTFCGMRPMRSLAFPVICVLGLQEQAFPRRDRLAEFDLMRKRWRPGDPRKGDEDRYLFLETLLCARRRLYLSYVGRDIRKNTPRQPSVLVRELLDYLDQQYQPAGGATAQKLSDRLTRIHPLQPFSPRAYAGESTGYDAYWCKVAQVLAQPMARGAEPTGWPGERLGDPPEQMREVTLEQLERFICHPPRYFVNSRLRVYLGEAAATDDDEPFALDRLQGFFLERRLLADYLQGRTPSRPQLSAEGALPHGPFADLVFADEDARVTPLRQSLAPYRGQRPEQLAVDLALAGGDGPRRLSGQIKGVYPGLGLLRWRSSALKGADILSLWLAHLAWCALGDSGVKRSALYTARESFVIPTALPPDAARAALERWLALYWEGLHRPLLVLPKASYAYALRHHRGGRSDPLQAAWSEWNGNAFMGIPGDTDDPYVQLVVRGLTGDPLALPEFATLAHALYDDALRARELR
jgi:exodeoxyribonuclease V gamma subunit